MKSRAFSALELLNLLKNKFDNNISEVMQKALAFASITSIDDNQDSKQNIIRIGNSRIRFSGLEAKKEQLLNAGCNREALKIWELIFSEIDKHLVQIGDKINYAKTVTSFYRWTDSKKQKSIQTIYFVDPSTTPGFKLFFYGYNQNFASEIIAIIKTIGWEINIDELNTTGKTEVIPGLIFNKANPISDIAKFGAILFDKKLLQNQPFDKVHQLISAVTNHMIKTLQIT
jgi:hypothetical protein